MSPHSPKGLNAGWILVTLLLSLCILGTWMTSRNFRSQIIMSSRAILLEKQGSEGRVSAVFSPEESSRIRIGQIARVSIGHEGTPVSGKVSSNDGETSLITLTEGSADQSPAGTPCTVTIDTTIPPGAAVPASSPAP